MKAPGSSKQSDVTNVLCSVCASQINLSLQPELQKSQSSVDWYTSRLEWALESSIAFERICRRCDHLLISADWLESELSAVLVALQRRHRTRREPPPGAESADDGDSRGCSQKRAYSEQSRSPSVGSGGVLISIWTDQPPSPPPEGSEGAALPIVRNGGMREDECKPKPEDEERQWKRQDEQDGQRHPAEKRRAKLAARLSRDDCSRTFRTASTLARHRRRAHRLGAAGAVRSGTEDGRLGEVLAEQQRPVSAERRHSGEQQQRNSLETCDSPEKQRKKSVGNDSLVEVAQPQVVKGSEKSDHARSAAAVEKTGMSWSNAHKEDEGTQDAEPGRTGKSGLETKSTNDLVDDAESTKTSEVPDIPLVVNPVCTKPQDPGPITREPPWSHIESVNVDASSEGSGLLLETGPLHRSSYSPSLVVSVPSADQADGQRLPMSHSAPAPRSLGDADVVLEHDGFPNLAMVPFIPDAEPVKSPPASSANELMDVIPDKYQELFITLDTDSEISRSATVTVSQHKPPPSSPSKVKLKNGPDSPTMDLQDNSRGPHRSMDKKAVPMPGRKQSKKARSSVSKARSSGTARRARLAPYERHGGKWRCLKCSALFASRTGAHGHALTHSDPDGGRCPRCDKTYANAYALRRHRAACLSGLPPSCHICGKIVADKAYLAQHVMTHSADAPKKHQCDRCGVGFSTGVKLRAHIAVEHSQETPHRCDICRREFALKAQLRRHCRTAHASAPVVTCEVCGKGFNRADHLKAHMTVHTGARPFVCGVCGRGFTRADTLADHTRLHTGEKPFKCAECGEAFREHRAYRRHLMIQHEKTSGEGAMQPQ